MPGVGYAGGREEGEALKGMPVVMVVLYLDHTSVDILAVILHYSFALEKTEYSTQDLILFFTTVCRIYKLSQNNKCN